MNENDSNASIKIQKDNLKILKKSLMTFDKFCKEYKSFSNRACFSFDYKQCGSFENWDIALSILNNLPPENRLCNEKIMQNVKVKPYFDIEFMRELFDITPEELEKRKKERIALEKERDEKGLPEVVEDLGKEDKTEIDSLKVYIKEKLILVFKEYYDIDLKPTDFLFANCHREIPKKGYKFSFHVVINTDYVVESSRNARFIAEKLKDALHADFKSIVDLNVYKGTQNFRMVGHCKSNQSKPGEISKPFIPENNVELEHYLVTNISSDYKILDTPDPEDYDRSYRIKNIKKLDEDIDENEFINNKLLELIKDYHPTAQFQKKDAKEFYQFNYLDKREKCFTSTDINPVYHDQLGFFAYITNNNDICLACHSARCEDLNNKKLWKIIGTMNNKEIKKEFKRVHFEEEDFQIPDFDIKNAINNSARGLSDLFCKMYQNPNRIKWIDQGRNGTSFFWNGFKWETDGRDYLGYLCAGRLVYVLRKFNNRHDPNKKNDEDVVSEETEPEELLKKSRSLIENLNKGIIHNNILKFVKPRISDDKFAEIIDIHPGFLSCKNGMVDLRTSELRSAVPDDNITKTLETEYNVNSDSSLFEKFVREITSDITGENIEKYNYFRWLIGYTLTGNPIKKIFIILYGPHGNNGKSLVMSVINNALDFYSVTMDKSVVLDGPKKTSGSHSTELAALENSRYAILNDTSESDAINDGQIKQLTGVTDKLSIREIFGKQREIKPIFVPWISTNFAIKMNLSDKAMSNRVVIIPFVLRYILEPKEDYERPIDTQLPEKLENNKEGTLKWLIDAAKFYYDNIDYPVPEFVKTEKESYNLEVNSYLAFIENNFEKIPNIHITKTDLLALYKEYARENGQKYIAINVEKEFDNFLEVGFMDKKGNINPRGRTKIYLGIRYNDSGFDDHEESIEDKLNIKNLTTN